MTHPRLDEVLIVSTVECGLCSKPPIHSIYMTAHGRFGECCDKHLMQMKQDALNRIAEIEGAD